MDNMDNIVKALCHRATIVKTAPLYQYDYGQVLQIVGVELPAAYEVHFSNEPHGTAITQIGNADGVAIPDQYLQSGANVYAWLYMHTGANDGETEITITIPVLGRAKPTDHEPTPVQQDAITQAIAALNAAVEQTGADVEAAGSYAEEAEQSARAAADSASSAQDSEAAAQGYAEDAAASSAAAQLSENNAGASAQGAADSAAAASASEQAAKASETAAAGSASSASDDAATAASAASTATQQAGIATSGAGRATQKAADAAASAQDAASSETAAAGSAAAAATSETNAETAETAAQTAQAAAEAAAQSVVESAAQIDTNKEDIADLKSDLSVLSSDVYEVTDNLVDIGREKNMWKQGYYNGSQSYAIHYDKKIPVAAGERLYGAVSNVTLEQRLALIFDFYDDSDQEKGSASVSYTDSNAIYPQVVPENTTWLCVSLSTNNYNYKITPTSVAALNLAIYVGYSTITKETMYGKYITAFDKLDETDNNIDKLDGRIATVESRLNLDLLDNEFGLDEVEFYGYSSNRYDITRLGTWQSASYATLRDVPVTEGEIIVIACNERKVFTQNIGAIEWYDSTGTRIGAAVGISTSFVTPTGGIYATYTVPANAVKVNVSVYGVGNYTAANTPEIGDYSYVGELYIKKGSLKTQPQAIKDINEISEKKIEHLSELLLNQSRNDFPNGTLYGFGYSSYTAVATDQKWVNSSHVNLYGECQDADVIHWGAIARSIAGTSAGFIEFLDSEGTVLWAQRASNASVPTNNQNGFTKVCVAPENSASFHCAIYGISSGEDTVIGKEYFIKGAFVFVGEMETVDFPHLHSSWLTKADEINQTIGAKFCFGIQTDSHYYDGISDNVAYNLSEYTNLIGTDFIANLGDIIQGYSARDVLDRPDRTRRSLTNIVRRYISSAKCPVLFAIGNHDSNRMHHDKFGTDEIPMTEMWNRLTKRGLQTCGSAKYQTGKFYYYVDFNDVRVIVCNSQDSDESARNFFVTDAQETWLRTEALDTNKPVLVLSHTPFIRSGTIDANYTASYAKIVSALQDFKTGGGTVIACISGHTHAQLSETVDGILYITCTRNYVDENTAEIFIVDLENKTIRTFGLGDANDRAFSYE